MPQLEVKYNFFIVRRFKALIISLHVRFVGKMSDNWDCLLKASGYVLFIGFIPRLPGVNPINTWGAGPSPIIFQKACKICTAKT